MHIPQLWNPISMPIRIFATSCRSPETWKKDWRKIWAPFLWLVVINKRQEGPSDVLISYCDVEDTWAVACGLWNCSETARKLLGNALKLLWNCSKIALRTALKLLWNCSKIALKLLWNCSKTALKLLWNCSGKRRPREKRSVTTRTAESSRSTLYLSLREWKRFKSQK